MLTDVDLEELLRVEVCGNDGTVMREHTRVQHRNDAFVVLLCDSSDCLVPHVEHTNVTEFALDIYSFAFVAVLCYRVIFSVAPDYHDLMLINYSDAEAISRRKLRW